MPAGRQQTFKTPGDGEVICGENNIYVYIYIHIITKYSLMPVIAFLERVFVGTKQDICCNKNYKKIQTKCITLYICKNKGLIQQLITSYYTKSQCFILINALKRYIILTIVM